MARKSKSLNEYQLLAQQKGLIFLETAAPRFVTERVRWKCERCNRVMRKAYVAVQRSPHSCYCQWLSLDEEDYRQLALRLGLQWIGNLPNNVYMQTLWQTASGERFSASYRNLAYADVPARYRRFVEEAHG